MKFGIAWLGWLTVAIPMIFAAAFAVDYTWRRRVLERIGTLEQLGRMSASLSSRRRTLRAVMFTVAVTLCAAALARPQVEGESTWRQRGIDVAVVVDLSKSMLAKDVYPSRIERTMVEIDRLTRGLEADRVASVAFAGASVYFPLTHDHRAARMLLTELSPFDMPPGSDLGEGVREARCLLRPDLTAEPGCRPPAGGESGAATVAGESAGAAKDDDRGRAIVVFTDGEDTVGRAKYEVARAAELGVQVYLIGVGTAAGELVPDYDGQGTFLGWKRVPGTDEFVTTRLDEELLRELAVLGGGANHYYWLGKSASAIDDLLVELDTLKKGDLDQRVIKHPREIFQWFLFPGFLLLVGEACLRERRRGVAR